MLTITNIKNPISVGIFSGLQFTTYNLVNNIVYLVDKLDNGTGFVVSARQSDASRVVINTTSNIVYSSTTISISVNTSNPIAPASTLQLYIPS